MSNVLFCDSNNNTELGLALGNSKRGKCWAVKTSENTPGSLQHGNNFFKRFDGFKEAEAFASAQATQATRN